MVDEDEICWIVAEILTDDGYEVSTAPNGEGALDLARMMEPDVIVLDMRVPVMDGWQFAREYRQTPGPSTPIVVMTAARDAASWASDVGADAYLAKPFDLEELLRVVRDHTGGSWPRETGPQPQRS